MSRNIEDADSEAMTQNLLQKCHIRSFKIVFEFILTFCDFIRTLIRCSMNYVYAAV